MKFFQVLCNRDFGMRTSEKNSLFIQNRTVYYVEYSGEQYPHRYLPSSTSCSIRSIEISIVFRNIRFCNVECSMLNVAVAECRKREKPQCIRPNNNNIENIFIRVGEDVVLGFVVFVSGCEFPKVCVSVSVALCGSNYKCITNSTIQLNINIVFESDDNYVQHFLKFYSASRKFYNFTALKTMQCSQKLQLHLNNPFGKQNAIFTLQIISIARRDILFLNYC